MHVLSGRPESGMPAAGRRSSGALPQTSARVDRAIRKFIDRQPPTDFYELLRYQLGSGRPEGLAPTASSQRLPGSLSLLVCEACGTKPQAALPLAVCISLIEEFGAIQEDLECRRLQRNGRPTVWRLWGRAQAMNAADGVHALAKVALLDGRRGLSPAVLLKLAEDVDQCWLAICEAAPDRRQRRRRPAQRIVLPALCALAARCGGLIAAAGDDVCERLRDFGELLGRMACAQRVGTKALACRQRAARALTSAGLEPSRSKKLASLLDCDLRGAQALHLSGRKAVGQPLA